LKTGFLDSAVGPRLFYRAGFVDSADAAVILIHGFGEHSGRYGYLADSLHEAGVATFGIDLRGHGQSEGPRGHVDDFDDFSDDISCACTVVQERLPGVPVFLMGHSMGGLAVSAFVARHPEAISGCILSSPVFGLGEETSWPKMLAVRMLDRWAPSMTLPAGFSSYDLSHDVAQVAAYANDPLVLRRGSVRLFNEAVRTQKWILDQAPDIGLPLLILAGADDRLADLGTTRDFMARYGGQDKVLQVFDGYRHEVFNERERDVPIGCMIDWLRKH